MNDPICAKDDGAVDYPVLIPVFAGLWQIEAPFSESIKCLGQTRAVCWFVLSHCYRIQLVHDLTCDKVNALLCYICLT